MSAAEETPTGRPLPSPYRPLSGPAAWTVGLLGLVFVLSVGAVVSDVAEYSLLQGNPKNIPRTELVASLERQGVIGIAQALLLLATAVAFIVWFHRAYKNLSALGADKLRYGTGWAIGAWFVPILNLFRPKQIANDIWRASDPEQPPNQADGWRARPLPPLYTAWWTVWVAGNILSWFAVNSGFQRQDD